MIVVSDTSPISALFLINRLELLPILYGQVVIPPAVKRELQKLETDFGHDLSSLETASWLKTIAVSDGARYLHYRRVLDEGESEALTLVHELTADLLLIDEIRGRKVAESEGIAYVGVLGVLLSAKSKGILVGIRDVLDDLRRIAGFHLGQNLYEAVLQQAGELE